ncbi:MAG TPA: phosphotransferase [Roseiflexaceae bacterium]|nr:phosphotransferase [Roseiflexaceae bacterium]
MEEASDTRSQLPREVVDAIASAVGGPAWLTQLSGGTNRRTYLVAGEQHRWVARAELAPALSLQRAVAAQARAHAAGVRTPVTLAYDLTVTEAGPYVWSVETFVDGTPLDHAWARTPADYAALRDLGAQLRRLHAVAVDAFGDLPPRPYPVYSSFRAWVQNKAKRIAPAASLAGGNLALIALIEQVYDSLADWYTGGARLCKGDCAGDNLLVDREHAVMIVDWEWAQGLDPAADIAYWCRFAGHPQAHELLLAAYEPDDLPLFRRRMQAHRVVHAVETIHVLDEHRHAFGAAQREAGIQAEWASLARLISDMD